MVNKHSFICLFHYLNPVIKGLMWALPLKRNLIIVAGCGGLVMGEVVILMMQERYHGYIKELENILVEQV